MPSMRSDDIDDGDAELRRRFERLRNSTAAAAQAQANQGLADEDENDEEELARRLQKLTSSAPIAAASSPNKNKSHLKKTPTTTTPKTPNKTPFIDYTSLVLTSPTSSANPKASSSSSLAAADNDSDVESLIDAVEKQVRLEERYGENVPEDVALEMRVQNLRRFAEKAELKKGGGRDRRSPSRERNSSANAAKTVTAAQGGRGGATPSKVISPLGRPPRPIDLDDLVKDDDSDFDDDDDLHPDEECCICGTRAVVLCVGCESDPYCANCWKEGHVGDDVGEEFRRHVAQKIATSRR